MKNIFNYSILISTIFANNTGYSGMYFQEGFYLSGNYSNQHADGENSNAISIGLSYLTMQESDYEKPTLSGTYEFSGFYSQIQNDDDLNMEMFSGGLNYYMPNNLKFGFLYDTLYDFSGQELDNFNEQGFNIKMKTTSYIVSLGYYDKKAFRFLTFIELLNYNSNSSIDITSNGQQFLSTNDHTNTNLLRLGVGHKKENLAFQAMTTINVDREARYTLGIIYGL